MTEFLHELVRQQERNIHVLELLESDPWRYSEPPPPFTGNENAEQLSDLRLGPY
jgi:hypothetical protein